MNIFTDRTMIVIEDKNGKNIERMNVSQAEKTIQRLTACINRVKYGNIKYHPIVKEVIDTVKEVIDKINEIEIKKDSDVNPSEILLNSTFEYLKQMCSKGDEEYIGLTVKKVDEGFSILPGNFFTALLMYGILVPYKHIEGCDSYKVPEGYKYENTVFHWDREKRDIYILPPIAIKSIRGIVKLKKNIPE